MLRLFVYGTLKRGTAAHARWCAGVVRVAPAHAHGRLHQLPEGYPALAVAPGAILARGTDDPEADVLVQERFEAAGIGGGEAGGERVEGELLHFSDTAVLKGLDDYEDARPDGCGLYVRVLIQVHAPGPVTAWAYCRELPRGEWPTGRG